VVGDILRGGEPVEREPLGVGDVRAGGRLGPLGLRDVVEDEVPGAVPERLDLREPDVDSFDAYLVAQDPARRVVGMLPVREVAVRQEPSLLAVVARGVFVEVLQPTSSP
jgi:hypothetical protein